MQKTALDRWLQMKYVYVCKVYCNTLPQSIPQGAVLEETTHESGGRYLYCFTLTDDVQLNELTATLELDNITYTSRVSEKGGLVGKLFNNPGKSFTLQVAWLCFTVIVLIVIFSGLPVKLWTYLSAEEESVKKPVPGKTESKSKSKAEDRANPSAMFDK
ncbi:MAG: hypothetical protein KA152_09925 [Verrucomicrobiales bacterium]|jgi:hypothetical protein|nr:hypothetical protein [Verrucomicrobiales bacterium]